MFHNVRSISSGTCENNQFENIDHETCSKIASSRNVDFRTVSNSKYAPGCVQVGEGSVYYNNTAIIGGSGANDAVQQLCVLPGSSNASAGATTIDIAEDSAKDKNDRMFDGTWLDRSIADGISNNKGKSKKDGANSGYFPVNIRTVHQAVFYVNPQ